MWRTLAEVTIRATTVDWLLLFGSVLLFLYVVGTWNYDYFKRRGIPSTRPWIPFLGDFFNVFISRRSFHDVVSKQYKDAEGHPVYGIFEFSRPIFVIRDPELIKLVTVKEFDNFINHRSMGERSVDPVLNEHLFFLKDQKWRDTRATVSPAFTTSKIKAIFPLISKCGDQVVEHFKDVYAKSKEGAAREPLPTDMKDIFSRLANDVIATAAFGVSCDSLKEPQNKFYHMGKVMTNLSRLQTMIFLGYMTFPKIMNFFKIHLLNKEAVDFFDSIVQETINERQKKGIFRPDILQLLIQARKGELKLEAEDAGEEENISGKRRMAQEDISAQAIIFFFAGFDSISTGLCLATHALSHSPEVQRKLQKEIDEVMDATCGRPSYEDVKAMKYLDAVINESLRVYSPAAMIDRICEVDSLLPAGSDRGPIALRRGDIINIPVCGLHHDPRYWEEPEVFRPERFLDENKHNLKPFAYLPFGIGPRVCVGQRLAVIEVKLVLMHLLSSFELHPCEKTKHPLQFMPGINVKAEGGFWCGITPR